MAHRCHTNFFIMIIIILATLILGEFSTDFYVGFFIRSHLCSKINASLELNLFYLIQSKYSYFVVTHVLKKTVFSLSKTCLNQHG